MPTRHSGITVGACSDPAYIPHHLPGQEDRGPSRLEQLVEQARTHPQNDEQRLPHRIICQGPIFWIADPLTRAVIIQVNGVVLGSSKVFLLDLHSACAGVIAMSHLEAGDDQRSFQTALALEHGQDFADLAAIQAGHDMEVPVTYTQFGPDGLEYQVFEVETFVGRYGRARGRGGISSLMPSYPLVRTTLARSPAGAPQNGHR